MKKWLLTMLPLALFFTPNSPMLTHSSDSGNIAAPQKLLEKSPTDQENDHLKRGVLTTHGLNFADNTQAAVTWSNQHFPTVFSEEIDSIKTINQQLRTKYMNRSELYRPFDDLAAIDNSFVTQTVNDMVLYANLTPEDFGIDSYYFVNNSTNVYNTMLKESLFGIDHGYFLGSLEKKPLNPTKREYIQLSLMIPKGTRVTRVGSLTEAQYILSRESTLHYLGKNFDAASKNVTISAQMVDRSELNDAAQEQEDEINTKLHALYGTPDPLVTLMPVGLNAGYLLDASLEAVTKACEKLQAGGVLSQDFFAKEKFHLTNGWTVHTEFFDELSEGKTLAECQELFDELFNKNILGQTRFWADRTCESIISFSHVVQEDNLPQLSKSEELAATLLHETFHYLIFSTNFFADRPLFQGDSKLFQDMIAMVKEEEVENVVNLLNDDYAEQDWEEFICEAFMAKFHPAKTISNRFKEEAPQTNRMLENIFDFAPPKPPANLKAVAVGGTSVTLTFDQAIDNIGVDFYTLYQNGKKIKTILTDKDDNGLSYPNPGEHQPKIEVKIDNLNQLTEYEFQITAVDDAQNESEKSSVLKIKTKDTEPPKLKGSLKGQPLVSSAARFNWPHPTDNDKVKEVKLYRSESSSVLSNNRKSASPKKEQTFVISGNKNYYTDTTIEKGKSYTYYMVAFDEAGNKSKESNRVSIRTEDKNDEKQNEDKAENTTSSHTNLNWSGAFDGISAAGFDIFSWGLSGGSWVFNGMTSVAGTATSALVDLTPGMLHQFVVVPVDREGNPLADGLPISVDAIDRSSIQTKDSVLYVGQQWQAEDNFVRATDEDGNSVPYNDKRVTIKGAVDTSKPGVYELTYSYKGVVKTSEATCKVTVKEDKSSITTKDSVLYVGQQWKKEDNFVSAIDEDGQVVPLNDQRISVTGMADPSKPNTYKVNYSFKGQGKTVESIATITVKEDKSSIKTKDSVLYVGQQWQAEDNFVSATDEEGQPVSFSDKRVSTNGAAIDTRKPGVYELKYSYKGKVKTSDSAFKVTVTANEEWFSEMKNAHMSNCTWQKGDRPDDFTGITFKNNIKEVMKDQLASYRVFYKGPSGEFNVSRNAYSFSPDGSIKVNFHEYNHGYGIIIKQNTTLEIFAVLKGGTEVKVYDHKERNEWLSEIENTYKSNYEWRKGDRLNDFTAITFKNNIKAVTKGQLDRYIVSYAGPDGKFNLSRKAYEFSPDGSTKINFLDYNGGYGIRINKDTFFMIFAVLKDGTTVEVYDHKEYEDWFAEIEKTHKADFKGIKGDRPDDFTGLIFTKNIKEVMKGQLASYRVIYDGPDGRFNKIRKAYGFSADGSIKVNFLEYNAGYGIRINYTVDLKIYAVLKNGYEINVYDQQQ